MCLKLLHEWKNSVDPDQMLESVVFRWIERGFGGWVWEGLGGGGGVPFTQNFIFMGNFG